MLMLKLETFIKSYELRNFPINYEDIKLLHELNISWIGSIREGRCDYCVLAISEVDANCHKCYAFDVVDEGLKLLDEIDISQHPVFKKPYISTGHIIKIHEYEDGYEEFNVITFSMPAKKFLNQKQIFGDEEWVFVNNSGIYSFWLKVEIGRLVCVDPWGRILTFNLPIQAINTQAITVVPGCGYDLFFIDNNLRYVWHEEELTGVNFPENSLFEWSDVSNAYFDIQGKYLISQRKGKLFRLKDGKAWNCPSLIVPNSNKFHQQGNIKVNTQLGLLSVQGYDRPLEVHKIGAPISRFIK